MCDIKGEGKRFLHGDLICTYTLPEYISIIYVDDLCIISIYAFFKRNHPLLSAYCTPVQVRHVLAFS